MTFRKFSKIFIGLLIIFIVALGLVSINHPIILKWISGNARHLGKPINAKVYTNGQINPNIKVFHVDKYWNGEKADYFLLYTAYADKSRFKLFSINKKENYAGSPASTNIRDYDFIAGYLFQSEVGSKFSPFTDDMKGFGFDPKLIFNEKQIKLNIPPNEPELKYDSIRIEL